MLDGFDDFFVFYFYCIETGAGAFVVFAFVGDVGEEGIFCFALGLGDDDIDAEAPGVPSSRPGAQVWSEFDVTSLLAPSVDLTLRLITAETNIAHAR